MGGRGQNRGRGGNRGGISKNPNHNRSGDVHIPNRSRPNDHILNRLGRIPVYEQKNSSTLKKYKFINNKLSTITSSVASLPQEPKIRMLSKKFLKSYYEIFDQPGRPNLDSQYNADAFFSISSTYPMPPMSSYGRNLLQVREPENRIHLLAHNKTRIAECLATQFSPTEHMVNLLSCDVPFYIVNPMSVITMHIVVTGVFKDTTETTNPLKAFTRVFVVKQVSADKQGEPIYEIFNDLFMLQLPTPDQIKRYHHEAQIIKRTSAAANPQDRPTGSTVNQAARSQEEMIQTIMAKTKMNKLGSSKLLEDCCWDMDKSMAAFNILFPENKIPQEFFTP